VHRVPRREQRERRQEPGEDDQEQADAVDADVVLDAERRDPVVALLELEPGVRRIEPRPQEERRRERDQLGQQRQVPHERLALALAAAADEQHQDGADERDENDG
jgi:hypothetical protein